MWPHSGVLRARVVDHVLRVVIPASPRRTRQFTNVAFVGIRLLALAVEVLGAGLSLFMLAFQVLVLKSAVNLTAGRREQAPQGFSDPSLGESMPFSVTWQTLLDHCKELSSDATLITPGTHKRFRITDVQESRLLIEFTDSGSGDTQPLQRDQFETLIDRIGDTSPGFAIEHVPAAAEPYTAVLSLHPRYEIDEREGIIVETAEPTTTQLVDAHVPSATDQEQDEERTEPDLDVYADAVLLIDALERHDPTVLDSLETPPLVNLYTLLSDVQRNASTLRQDVSTVLLERVHHDQPVHGQYGSIQRTSRRNRSLKDDEEVLSTLEDAGIPRERVLGIDREKVDEALEVIELSESAVYDIEESEYARKADVDEERKQSRLQGLKDQLALSDDSDAEQLRREVDQLEERIEELTSFSSGTTFQTHSESG